MSVLTAGIHPTACDRITSAAMHAGTVSLDRGIRLKCNSFRVLERDGSQMTEEVWPVWRVLHWPRGIHHWCQGTLDMVSPETDGAMMDHCH